MQCVCGRNQPGLGLLATRGSRGTMWHRRSLQHTVASAATVDLCLCCLLQPLLLPPTCCSLCCFLLLAAASAACWGCVPMLRQITLIQGAAHQLSHLHPPAGCCPSSLQHACPSQRSESVPGRRAEHLNPETDKCRNNHSADCSSRDGTWSCASWHRLDIPL